MNPLPDDTAWRRVSIGTLATLLFVAAAWNGSAFAIDASGLPDGGAWVSMGLVAFLGTLLYAGPASLVSLGAVIASASGNPDQARACAGLSAIVAAACAAGLVWLGVQLVFGSPTDVAFGVVSVLLALVLLAPLALCIRQYRCEHA